MVASGRRQCALQCGISRHGTPLCVARKLPARRPRALAGEVLVQTDFPDHPRTRRSSGTIRSLAEALPPSADVAAASVRALALLAAEAKTRAPRCLSGCCRGTGRAVIGGARLSCELYPPLPAGWRAAPDGARPSARSKKGPSSLQAFLPLGAPTRATRERRVRWASTSSDQLCMRLFEAAARGAL